MQIHLLDLLSPNPTTRQAGEHNLELCMVFMSNLCQAHASAATTYNLFAATIEKIRNGRLRVPDLPIAGSCLDMNLQEEVLVPFEGQDDSSMVNMEMLLFFDEIFPQFDQGQLPLD